MNGILQSLYKLQALDLTTQNANPSHTAELRAAIPQGMLTNYDRARARGKKGIALVRNNVCTNCRMQMPVAVTASLMGGMIQSCGNCGLYLCLPESNEQTVATTITSTSPPRRAKKKAIAQ